MAERDETARTAERLVAAVRSYGSTLVAFSGGVDSSVVVAAAVRALGAGAAAVTAVSPAVPAAELEQARRFCAELGVVHHLIDTSELEVRGYRANGRDRCYFCKTTLLDAALGVAVDHGYETVATGTNASDVAEGFRPGIRAAAERGARAPLAELGVTKETVRALARLWSLPTWDKPAMACLSSRIAYGLEISAPRLARVERAEAAIRELLGPLGGADLRVRDLGDAVRLEVDEELVEPVRRDPRFAEALRLAGFADIPAAVTRFRSGSMNQLPVIEG